VDAAAAFDEEEEEEEDDEEEDVRARPELRAAARFDPRPVSDRNI
jgi:hypothetical protein